jgi:hypothetical protein
VVSANPVRGRHTLRQQSTMETSRTADAKMIPHSFVHRACKTLVGLMQNWPISRQRANASIATSRACAREDHKHSSTIDGAIDALSPRRPLCVRRGSRGFQNYNIALPHHTPAKRREILGPRLTRLGSGAQEALRLLGAYSGRLRGGGGWHVQKSNLPRAAQGIGVIGSTGRPFEFLVMTTNAPDGPYDLSAWSNRRNADRLQRTPFPRARDVENVALAFVQ